jgi:hypothetical protein
MNEHCKTADARDGYPDGLVVRRVILLSGLLLIILAACGWLLFSRPFAQSVLIGGLLVNGSFFLLKRDAKRLMERIGGSNGPGFAAVNFEKTRFFLRYFARLVVLGLLLFALASQVTIDVIGLTLGLATVMVSVVIIGLSTEKCWMPSKV